MSLAALDLFQPTEKFSQELWQTQDIDYMEFMEGTGDWSEMGCYKTSTVLWLAERRNVRNMLIVTTKNGKGTYFDAFPKCLDKWEVFNVNLRKTTRFLDTAFQPEVDLHELLQEVKLGFHNKKRAFLIHYDLFQERYKEEITKVFEKIPWAMLVCDEAHRLKNRKTAHTRNIKRLQARYRHVMTGTGFINNPAEIWSLLNFVERRKWGSYWAFRNTYCQQVQNGRGQWEIVGIKKHKVAEFRKIREKYGPRHEMREVHKDIAEPIVHRRTVQLSATQKRMYKDIKTVLATLDEAGESLTSPNVISQLNRLRQICVATPEVEDVVWNSVLNRQETHVNLVEPSSKLDEVMDIMEDIRWDAEMKRQVVIFSNFKDPLYLLEERFRNKGIPFLHMQQKHSEMERYRLWHDVWPKGNHQVFLSTVALGGESINLTSAQYVIFLDQSWSPKDNMQAIGRVYRPGQTGVCELIYIDAENTVDQYVGAKLERKMGWFKEIFGKDE